LIFTRRGWNFTILFNCFRLHIHGISWLCCFLIYLCLCCKFVGIQHLL
jgi:hypothetical protein